MAFNLTRELGDLRFGSVPREPQALHGSRDLALSNARAVSVGSWVRGSGAMNHCDLEGAMVGGNGLQRREQAPQGCHSITQNSAAAMYCTAGSGSDRCGIRFCTHRIDSEQGGGEGGCAAGLFLCRDRVPSLALLFASDWRGFRHFK